MCSTRGCDRSAGDSVVAWATPVAARAGPSTPSTAAVADASARGSDEGRSTGATLVRPIASAGARAESAGSRPGDAPAHPTRLPKVPSPVSGEAGRRPPGPLRLADAQRDVAAQPNRIAPVLDDLGARFDRAGHELARV